MEGLLTQLQDRLRTSPLMVVGMLGIAWLALFAPFKLGVAIWMLTKIFLAAYSGYWIDRLAFKHARPHTIDPERQDLRFISRAIIIGACIISGGFLA